MKTLASLLAMLLVSKRQASDTYEALVRPTTMNLSAEILWTLMPARTVANDRVVVSAMLESAYLAGGDAFDYALDGQTVHLAIFDAMGNDTAAGLTATIAVGCYRNSRRQGMDLVACAEAIGDAIAEQFQAARFTTGILADLDTRTGVLTWVNRGHHPPMVLRHGRVAVTLETSAALPMGFNLGETAPSARCLGRLQCSGLEARGGEADSPA
ncbi:PP2C family protein-serine/threonine phosphatase [Nonomuraea ferruginea]